MTQGPPPSMRPPFWHGALPGFFIGGVVGVVGMVTVVLVLYNLGLGSGDMPGRVLFALVVFVPLLVPLPLVFFQATRGWGVGMLAGIAVTNIVLAGACVALYTPISGT